MDKRVLVTSTDMMMAQFLLPHVMNLSRNGFAVEIACSDVGGRMEEIRHKLAGSVKAVHVVRLTRSPASPINLKGFRDLKRVIEAGRFDMIWTNEPVMGIATRLAARNARKRGTKVLYMVHGFHFYKGAPVFNWMLFYPIEWLASGLCDEIVTINQEDFRRAKNMRAPSVKYIHGIGVDTTRLNPAESRCDIRGELGISEDSFLILSVGELLPRKNQQVIIKALGLLKDSSIHYILCGKGRQLASLEKLAADWGVAKRVHFLGYRKDVMDLYGQADLLAIPSKREGLGLAGLEAMYCGLAVLSSDTSGPRDYMENGKTGYLFDPDDAEGFAGGIRFLKENPHLRGSCGRYNRQAVIPFCMEHVKDEVMDLFRELL